LTSADVRLAPARIAHGIRKVICPQTLPNGRLSMSESGADRLFFPCY